MEVRPSPEIFHDLVYANVGDRDLHLDLYLPPKAAESKRPIPLIIWIHGGGWIAGSRVHAKELPFAYYGYALASIEYRLSKEAKWPAQIVDCKAAVSWLRAHAEAYHLDPKRFGVIGHSAGGHLAAMVGTTGNSDRFQEEELPGASSRVQAVCDMSGPTDFLQMDRESVPGSHVIHASPESNESRLFGAPIDEIPALVESANPARYVDRHDPPTCLIHGNRDLVVPPGQAMLLYDALQRRGVKAELHEIVGQGHDLLNDGTFQVALGFFNRVLHHHPQPSRNAS